VIRFAPIPRAAQRLCAGVGVRHLSLDPPASLSLSQDAAAAGENALQQPLGTVHGERLRAILYFMLPAEYARARAEG